MCGNTITEKLVDNKIRQVCPFCDFVHYMNPAPAAGVLLVENGRILLVRRKYEPKKGMWSIPAGFLEADEDIKQCAIREMKEETQLDVELEGLFNVYSAFDDPRTTALLVVYLAKRVGGELRTGDDASEAAFFNLDDLPKDIAFKAHRIALAGIREFLKS